MVATRKRDHIFRRSNSENWRVRTQLNGKSIEKSLGTTEYAKAEILAAPIITEHKKMLLARRPSFDLTWVHELEPGRLHIVDGERIYALDRELHFLDQDGRTIKTESNGGPAYRVVGQVPRAPRARARFEASIWQHDLSDGPPMTMRPTLAAKNGDDAIFETYLKDRNLSADYEREARATWHLFKSLVSKPLKDCDRDDGRVLVAHFQQQKLKRATIQKKIGWLVSACNFAIKEKKMRFNPFSSVIPKLKAGEEGDELERKPLDADDIENIKRNLNRLSASNQLLIRILATTGCRLSEAYQIASEAVENGVRYCVIGKKTKQSKRRVPFPADLLPYLPSRIEAPLFEGSKWGPKVASKALNEFLHEIGVTDPVKIGHRAQDRKVLHGLRHRAQDRLRAAGCPEDIRWAILGHEEATVAAGYGEGFPVPMLKEWIDRIGF